MSFTDSEKAFLFSMGVKISDPPVADELGAKSLERLFLSDPGTEIYFYQFNNGGKIMKAIGNAAQNLDNLDDALSPPNDLQPQNFWLNPDNFKMMSNTLNGVLANQFPREFNTKILAAWDKFLSTVSSVLESKYK
ncbi:hemoglobin subunit alpha-3-like isoform X2 [Anomaloglossus baeobatrachus]|uniref:hemoglobin subunit alpha-3-like isoform X2 n=1 Tax=Anomaloglossus baeobatrachus TaxID=238106 RepID=UPI003F4F9389